MQKPLLIFDFFGVIVEEVAHGWLYERLDERSAKHVIATILVDVDTGAITPEECFVKLEKITKVPAKQIEEDWLNIGKLKEDTVAFINDNKHNYHFVILSNAGTSFINKIFDRYPLTNLFSKLFISSDLKMAKPDPEIFKYVLKHADVTYSYAVMIDDNASNIKAARDLGLYGILFKDMASAAQELKEIANTALTK